MQLSGTVFGYLLLLLFISCSTTTINVTLLAPAEKEIRDIKIITVLPFTVKSFRKLTHSNGITKTDEMQIHRAHIKQQLISLLQKNGHYNLVESPSSNSLHDILKISKMTSRSGTNLDIDAVISGSCDIEVFDNVSKKSTTDPSIVAKIKSTANTTQFFDTIIEESISFNAERKIRVSFSYNMIATKTGEIVASDNFGETEIFTAQDSASEQVALEKLGSIIAKLNSFTDQSNNLLIAQIAPHYVTSNRSILKGKSDKMRRALNFAVHSQWDDAKSIWEEVLANHSSQEDNLAARANLALYYELVNNFDQSAEFYKQCFEQSTKKSFLKARQRVLDRQTEVMRLKDQLDNK